ncbi:MAG: hypothetical protein ACK4Z8_10320 [Novosphingobium sp.]
MVEGSCFALHFYVAPAQAGGHGFTVAPAVGVMGPGLRRGDGVSGTHW